MGVSKSGLQGARKAIVDFITNRRCNTRGISKAERPKRKVEPKAFIKYSANNEPENEYGLYM